MYLVVMAVFVFSNRRLVELSKSDVPILFLHLGLDGSTSLSDIHLTAITGDAAHTWNPQSQVSPRSSFTARRKLESSWLAGQNF
jgi:hypothetical protein